MSIKDDLEELARLGKRMPMTQVEAEEFMGRHLVEVGEALPRPGSGWAVVWVRDPSSFDLGDPTQFLACSHFTNLRAGWLS